MEVMDAVYFFFGLFSLYAVYAIASGQWDFSAYLVPIGQSIAVFLGLP